MLSCMQMKLISEPYHRERGLSEKEGSSGRLLKQKIFALRLHFAHVTEHIQEMAKHTMNIVGPKGQSNTNNLPAVHERERVLQGTIAKLVSLARLNCLVILEQYDVLCILLQHLMHLYGHTCGVAIHVKYENAQRYLIS
jgi:hypothetical protein